MLNVHLMTLVGKGDAEKTSDVTECGCILLTHGIALALKTYGLT